MHSKEMLIWREKTSTRDVEADLEPFKTEAKALI